MFPLSEIRRLTFPLAPQPDEVFTSWLVRLAAAHRLPTSPFCNLIAGGKTEFNRDMDGPTCERLLMALAARTGFSADRLRQEQTFGGFSGRLFALGMRATFDPYAGGPQLPLPASPLPRVRCNCQPYTGAHAA